MYARTYETWKECTAKMTPELEKKCRIYQGHCDPAGINYCPGEKSVDQVAEMLLNNGRNILRGREEDFVCIPQCQYEQILQTLLRKE